MTHIHSVESLTPRTESPFTLRRVLAVSALSFAALGMFLPKNIADTPVDGGLQDRINTDTMIAEELAEGPETNDTLVGEFDFGNNPNAELALLSADQRTDIDLSQAQLKATIASAALITNVYQIPQPHSRFEVWVDDELSEKTGQEVLLAIPIDSES